MSYKSISLPFRKKSTQDSEGFPTEKWDYIKGVQANFQDTTRQDEILAHQLGYEATVIVEIAACAYNGASFFLDESNGQIYDIKRTYKPEKTGKLQITGERREHGRF